MNTKKILEQVKGISFKTISPFLVADLSRKTKSLFEKIPTSKHEMEDVPSRKKTSAHKHQFPSFYKSANLDVMCDGERFPLPTRALVLVLPDVDHSWWASKGENGSVGSVDLRHRKQILAV